MNTGYVLKLIITCIMISLLFTKYGLSSGQEYLKRNNRFDKDQASLTLAFVSKTNVFVRRSMASFFRKALDAVNRNTSMSFHGRYRLTYVHQDDFDKYSPPEAFQILCDKVCGMAFCCC